MIQKQLRLLRMLPLLALATVLALSCPRIVLAANTASTQVTLSVSDSIIGGNGSQTHGSGNADSNGSTSNSGNTSNNGSSSETENTGNNGLPAVAGNAGNNAGTSDNRNNQSGAASTSRFCQTHGAKTGDKALAEFLLFFGLALMSASVVFLLIGKREPEKYFTSHKNL